MSVDIKLAALLMERLCNITAAKNPFGTFVCVAVVSSFSSQEHHKAA